MASPAAPPPSRPRAYGMALASALCAGASVVAGKIGVGGAATATYLAWLFTLSVAFSGVWSLAAPRTQPRRATPRGRRLLLAHAALAVAGCWGWYAGLVALGPGVASFASRAEVLITIALGIALLGDRLRRLEVVGGLLALAGLVLLCLPGETGAGERAGLAWVLLGALAFGTSEIFAKVAVLEVDTSTFVLARSALLALAWIALALLTGAALLPPPYVVAAAAAAAFLGPVLARGLYMHAIRTLPLSRAALLAQVQPLCAALIGFLVLGDLPRPLQWAGGLLLLAGTMLVVRAARAPAPPDPSE